MSPITILDQANVPMGPFTREQVLEKLQRGEVTLSSLAFTEGLTQWTPLREIIAPVEGAITPPPVAPAPYSYAATMQPPSHYVYAGFWLRFCAAFLDGIVLFFVGVVLGGGIGFVFGLSGALGHRPGRIGIMDADGNVNLPFVFMELIILGISVIVRWLYFALQESSSAQATLGKRALGLRVTDLGGGKIGFGRATGRFFSKYISALTLLIGFIMAGFTERKQALHDMIAGTLVVKD